MSGSNIAGNIIQILAGLPEFLRKPMLKSRLIEFFTLPENEKRETIINALTAAPAIDSAILSNLVKTWIEVICEFDEGRRKVVFDAYVNVIATSPDLISKLDIDELIRVFNTLPDDKRELLIDSLNMVIKALPADIKSGFIDSLPQNAKKTLKI
ncbi:MAG: hypothetical protein QXU32_08225 [Nitrososphaerales archaeon]